MVISNIDPICRGHFTGDLIFTHSLSTPAQWPAGRCSRLRDLGFTTARGFEQNPAARSHPHHPRLLQALWVVEKVNHKGQNVPSMFTNVHYVMSSSRQTFTHAGSPS